MELRARRTLHGNQENPNDADEHENPNDESEHERPNDVANEHENPNGVARNECKNKLNTTIFLMEP